jgi:hypothetical protein
VYILCCSSKNLILSLSTRRGVDSVLFQQESDFVSIVSTRRGVYSVLF